MAILNFSMNDLNHGRRFYDCDCEEAEQPRKKIVDDLEARQFNEENYEATKPQFNL